MKTIDYLFILIILVFSIYGIVLGVKTMHKIRKNSINEFEHKRKQIRKEFENE